MNEILRSPREEMAKAFEAVSHGLASESDRGAAVLASAWLEDSLTRILLAYLKQGSKKDELLSPGCPAGDFGTKIILADRLGLIHPSMRKSLDTIRKLRNEFAHISSDLSFDTQSVKSRTANLFYENRDLVSVMGKILIDAGLIKNSSDQITVDYMLEHFSRRQLFDYLIGFLNGGLALIRCHLQPAKQQYSLSE